MAGSKAKPKNPATSWTPQPRILAGGGLGLAIANIVAYYFEMPSQIEASVAVIITTLIAYLWSDKLWQKE